MEEINPAAKAANWVGALRLPEGNVTIQGGIVLKKLSEKVNEKFLVGAKNRGMDKGLEAFGKWLGPMDLQVVATIDDTPHGRLLHVSVSYPKRDPAWNIIKAVRYAFFPTNCDVMMVLPRDGDYVNLMPHCFQMWQIPEKWGLQ